MRKVCERAGLSYSSTCPWDPSVSLGQNLLTPTRIYIRQLLPAIQAGLLKALSHITGGGFTENVPRMLPKNLGVELDLNHIQLQECFKWIMTQGDIAPMEMLRTFNCGIGMVCVVAPHQADEAIRILQQSGDAQVVKMGRVTSQPGVTYTNIEVWAKQVAT